MFSLRTIVRLPTKLRIPPSAVALFRPLLNQEFLRLPLVRCFSQAPTVPPHAEVMEESAPAAAAPKPVPLSSTRLSPNQIRAIVKVFSYVSRPNYFSPWQNKPITESTGSGFVIGPKQILTNAHVVSDQKFVQVRRYGDPAKYTAKVIHAGHECDLALLTVEDDVFWHDLPSLQFADVPDLQDDIQVVGYPLGGDNICVTRGVVSRIDTSTYSHGQTNLLAVQIDAAINPGSSGGPAFKDDKVVGVAFQMITGASNVGYIIPLPVIGHFLRDVTNGSHKHHPQGLAFCTLGIAAQQGGNKYLQKFLKVPDGRGQTGILVSRVHKYCSSYGHLQPGDLIMAVDGLPIAADGTIEFRGAERIGLEIILLNKFAGDLVEVEVLRAGKVITLKYPVKPPVNLVPVQQFDRDPSWMVVSGLVFIPLSQPYLHEWGDRWFDFAPRELVHSAVFKPSADFEDEQIVVLSQVLLHEVTASYDRFVNSRVVSLNGVPVRNLRHLCAMVDAALQAPDPQSQLLFQFKDDRVLLLDVAAANATHQALLQRYRIPADRSPDLRNVSAVPAPPPAPWPPASKHSQDHQE